MSYEDPSDGKEEAASSMVALSVMVPPTREQLLEQRFGDYEVGFSFPQVAAQAAPAAQPRVTKKAKSGQRPPKLKKARPRQVMWARRLHRSAVLAVCFLFLCLLRW